MKSFKIYDLKTNKTIVEFKAKNIGAAWDAVNTYINNANIIDINVKSI